MSNLKSIVLGGGCFWCLEAYFNNIKGVSSVFSGYTAGHVKNPDYKSVCTGTTGHNEVIKINYDSDVINLDVLLDIFFTMHDPTTLNRQGNDVGTQYRSGIYYNDESEIPLINEAKSRAAKLWVDPVVTEVLPLDIFYQAEDYHLDYYKNNPNQGYCRIVINPKVSKLRSKFAQYIKA